MNAENELDWIDLKSVHQFEALSRPRAGLADGREHLQRRGARDASHRAGGQMRWQKIRETTSFLPEFLIFRPIQRLLTYICCFFPFTTSTICTDSVCPVVYIFQMQKCVV